MNDDVKVGRKPLYNTPEEMEIMIDDYFDSCKPNQVILKDDQGNIIYNKKTGEPMYERTEKPSIVGLALHLGYASRQSIYDNEKGQFSYILKKARSRVELWVLNNAMEDGMPTALGIFLLKQFGYQDKVDLNHTGDISIGKPPTPEEAEFPE